MSFFKKHYSYQPFGDKYKFDQLMFDNNSELLRCYCSLFIKGKMAPECNTNARTLVEYFNIHGKLLFLMKEVAKREIETTNNETQVFRGNTSFTRLFGEYSHLCLLPYLRAVTKDTITTLTDETIQFCVDDITDRSSPLHNQTMTLFCQLISSFVTKLMDSIHLLPPHFHQLIRFISVEIGKRKNAKSTPQNTFNLLFFIRLIFPVFNAPQHVMDTIQPPSPTTSPRLTFFAKICQSLLNESQSQTTVPDEVAKLVASTANQLFEAMTHPRSGYMTEKSGLDFSLQPSSHQKIIELIKSELEELKTLMTKDVDKLVDALECNKNEDSVMTEMQQSLEFCSDTYNERLTAVEDEITDLTDEIQKYQQKLKMIKKCIDDEDELTIKLKEEIKKLEFDSPSVPNLSTLNVSIGTSPPQATPTTKKSP